MESRSKERVIVLFVACALAVALTWPVVAHFASAGRLDTGDGRYSIWNVAWVARALTTNPSALFQANIFHPHENALAFSEANLVAGLIAVPVWLLTTNALAASNWTILCSFALSFLTTYLLVRRLTGSVAGAALAAFHFAYSPFVFAHIPHVQLLMTFPLPLVLLALHGFVEAPGVRRALALGAALALQALASGYYGFFAGLVTALGILWFGVAFGHWRQARYWALSATAAIVAIAIVAPFFLPYIGVREDGFTRTIEEARLHSVRWRAYLASPILVHRWMLPLIGSWREVLFPGFLPIIFTIVAVARSVGPRPESVPMRGRVLGFYLVVAAMGFWASLGPDAGLYRAMYEVVPFFEMLRAPARFGLLVTFALAVLAGVGFASIERVLGGRKRKVVVATILSLAVARSTVGGLALTEAPPVPLAYKRLKDLPSAPVFEFPYYNSRNDRHRNTEYMVWSTLHWKPLINGYSDHTPAGALQDMVRLAGFPDAQSRQVLRARGARYVLVHWYAVENEDERRDLEAAIRHEPSLRRVVDGDISLYEVISSPGGN
jgi:hypothetical protein